MNQIQMLAEQMARDPEFIKIYGREYSIAWCEKEETFVVADGSGVKPAEHFKFLSAAIERFVELERAA